jgi:transposase
MSGFIEGENRHQTTMFPESLDEYVSEDNPVRVVDLFIDSLDISGLGFRTVANSTGRPGYHPSVMLKLYVYGYLNRVQSSRRLEREAQRNVELMWLTGRLAPDFKTIADFRKDNGEAIQLVCKQFVQLCRRMDLLNDDFVAVDGSKFKAVNNRDKNFTKAKMKRRLEQIDESIARYLSQIASADLQDNQTSEAKTKRLTDKIDGLKKEIKRLKKLEVEMLASPDEQISLTDPDARSMATSGRGTGMVGYNVQSAVDVKSHLIVAHEVTNEGHDRYQLFAIGNLAKETLEAESLDVVADRGYYSIRELEKCYAGGVFPTMPIPQTSGSISKGRFSKRDFKYIEAADEYECPAGERLEWRFRTVEGGVEVDKYWTSACYQCPLKKNCTTEANQYRRISRLQSEELAEHMQMRLETEPDRMKIRRSTVEHPFGTIKCWMGHTHFQMKRLKNVATEMSLHVLAYNMKRCINMLGVNALMEAIRALVRLFASLSVMFRVFVSASQGHFWKIPRTTVAMVQIFGTRCDCCTGR